MSDLTRQLQDARAEVEPDWSPQREQTVARALARRRTRRARLRLAAGTVAVTLLVAAAGSLSFSLWQARSQGRLGGLEVAGGQVRFPDGSSATPLDPGTLLRPQLLTRTEVVVQLARGGARFEVTPAPARVFRVEAGAATVEVVGTRFTVERLESRVRVAVENGHVRVRSGGAVTELGAGQSGLFPRAPEPLAAAPVPASAPAVAAPAVAAPAATAQSSVAAAEPAAARRRPDSTWRLHAREGDYGGAFEVLRREGQAAVRGTPDDLLLAADVMRLSHHPRQAVAPLRRVIREHARDPRATLAAFTLGRVLLEELDDPRAAAAAFALVRQREPGGHLAEDALAREVEAWSRAGEPARARARAQTYLKHYPDGRRTRSVRRYGGVE